ncbi:MAG: nucleotide exchange factor GrpE [Candidatus Azotimanducaceae bacterium]
MSEADNESDQEDELEGFDLDEGSSEGQVSDEAEAEVVEDISGGSNEESAGDPEEIAQKSDEIAALKDQLLRRAAEFENVKRRSARDVENAHKFGAEKLISDLLPVVDSLEKALELAAETQGAEAMTEGINLSVKMFLDVLEKNGLSVVDPLGEPFDPSLQEALAAVPNEDAEPNTVMEVIQKGYSLNDRLVRAAKVVVVKD